MAQFLDGTTEIQNLVIARALKSDYGKQETVVPRFLDGFYIIDQLFESAVLVLGTGRDKNTIVIRRGKT